MKLKNKETGEIGYLYANKNENYNVLDENDKVLAVYETLEAVVEKWQDYEEPKEYWHIFGTNITKTQEGLDKLYDERNKEIGNYFSSREEAEKARDKLKALKRLRDKGFRFILDGETEMPMFVYSGANGEKCITSAEESKQCRDDIKLLFSQEDD